MTQVVDNRGRSKTTTGKPFDRRRPDLADRRPARTSSSSGPLPFFYLPRFKVEADDLDPPLQGISFSTNNYFGQQFRTRFDIFNLFNIRHLPEVDVWNLDVDYLSARDKSPGQGIALGTEIGWYGADLLNDIRDPYHKNKDTPPSRLNNYSGYFDTFGLFDGSRDVLGLGPAVITNGRTTTLDGREGVLPALEPDRAGLPLQGSSPSGTCSRS